MSLVASFDCNATFFVNFEPTGVVLKLMAVGVAVAEVVVVVPDLCGLPAPSHVSRKSRNSPDHATRVLYLWPKGRTTAFCLRPGVRWSIRMSRRGCVDGPWFPEFPRWPANAGMANTPISVATATGRLKLCIRIPPALGRRKARAGHVFCNVPG